MRDRENYYKRLEAVQTYFLQHPKTSLNEATAYFSQIPKGTMSATLSFMYQTGHLVKTSAGRYSVPAILSSPKQIAGDIWRNQKKKESDAKKFIYTTEAINGVSFMTDVPPTPKNLFNGEEFETMQVQIQKAIELLKSNGYKILAKKTEYTEI